MVIGDLPPPPRTQLAPGLCPTCAPAWRPRPSAPRQVRRAMHGGSALRAARLRSHAAACIRRPLRRRAAFCENQSGRRRACSHIFRLGKGCFLQAEGSRTVCGCPQSGYKRDKALARSRVMRLWRNVRYKARRFCGNPMDGSGIAACFPSASLTKAPSANQCPPHNAQPALIRTPCTFSLTAASAP